VQLLNIWMIKYIDDKDTIFDSTSLFSFQVCFLLILLFSRAHRMNLSEILIIYL